MDPLTVAAVGSQAVGALGMLKKRKKFNYGEAWQWFQGLNPQGHLTPEDHAAAEATRNRLASSATQSAKGLRLAASRRLQARGLLGSPATEAVFGRIGEEEAAGREHAAGAAEAQLYDVRMGRESFQRQGALQAFSAKLGGAYGDQARDDLRRSTYLNSLLEYTPRILDYLNKGKGGGVGDYVNEGEPKQRYP